MRILVAEDDEHLGEVLARGRMRRGDGDVAGIVLLAGITEASKAGGRGGPATFSALNFTESGLNFHGSGAVADWFAGSPDTDRGPGA